MQKFSFWWIVCSVIGLFAGLVLNATSVFTENKNIGTIFLVASLISIFLFMMYSVFQWFKFKKGEGLKNLVTAYILLAFMFVIGGLVGAFLTFPDGLTYFIVGLSMIASFFVYKLISAIFSKEEDFL